MNYWIKNELKKKKRMNQKKNDSLASGIVIRQTPLDK